MKSILLVLLLAFTLTSCSVDNDEARFISEDERTFVINIDTQYDYTITVKHGNDNGVAYFTDIQSYSGSEAFIYYIEDSVQFFSIKIEFDSSSNSSEIVYFLREGEETLANNTVNVIDSFVYSRYL